MIGRNGALLGAAVVVIVVMFEAADQLHGPDWAMVIAGGCIGLVGLGALFMLAKWADKNNEERARKAEKDGR